MNEQELQDLLRQLDQNTPTPPLTVDLAQRVNRKVHYRKRIRRAMATVGIIVICIASLGLLSVRQKATLEREPQAVIGNDQERMNQSNQNTHQQVAQLQTDVKRLEEQINERLAFIEKILERQEQRQGVAQLEQQLAALGDPLEELEQQVDQAALTIYYQANRKLHELNLKEEAIADFQKVIKLFPKSFWAEKAQEQLQQLTPNSKGNLI